MPGKAQRRTDGANFLAVWSGAVGGTSIQGRLISPTGSFMSDPFVNIHKLGASRGRLEWCCI